MFRMFGVRGAAAVLRRGALHGSGSVGGVRWAPLLTSANVRPELGDRRSCVRDLKTTVAWWRSRGGYLACNGLRRLVLLGSGWLAWDIVGDDGAREVGRLSASSWVVVWSGGLYGVELSCATVLMFHSNRLLFELSLRGVVRLFWPVVASLCLLWCLVPLFNIIGSSPA